MTIWLTVAILVESTSPLGNEDPLTDRIAQRLPTPL